MNSHHISTHLDLFSMNSTLDENPNPDSNLEFPRVQCRYFSPHSFKGYGSSLSISQQESSLSFFHNNIVSLNKHPDNLVAHYLDELDFHFNVIGGTETKITKSNEHLCNYQIPGYNFEQVPTPLVSRGVGLFIDDTLNYTVSKKLKLSRHCGLNFHSSNKKKNIICGIIYRQHNSPDLCLNYLTDTLEKLNLAGKRVCLLGDFNLCLLKTQTSHYSHDFLTTLQGNYLIPTIDKPTPVHRTTATLIDNIFVNNPEQVSGPWVPEDIFFLSILMVRGEAALTRGEKNNLWSQEYATSFPCEKSVQNLNWVTDWILPCPQPIKAIIILLIGCGHGSIHESMNAKKSNYAIFRPYQNKIQNIPKICIFDYDSNKTVNLEYKDSIKYLGVLIDENLSWL